MCYINKVQINIFTRTLFGLSRKMSKSSNNIGFTIRNQPENEDTLSEAKEKLKNIFYAGFNSVKPQKLIENRVKIEDNALNIDEDVCILGERVYTVGFGKAVMGMAVAMEKLLGNRLIKGIVSIPRGLKSKIWENCENESFPILTGVIDYRENSLNNQPDDDTLMTTEEIINLAESLTEEDTLIVLISGGGSALCSMPRPLINHEEKLNICRDLFNSGANIKEVNLIRQKLSTIKAGGLARIAHPARVIGLVLSDIIGDPIELIASGPTVYSPKDPKVVEAILKKYNIYNKIEGNLKDVLLEDEIHDDNIFINMIDNKKEFNHVRNFIIGNNSIAINNARIEALRQTLNPIILSNNIDGLVSDIAVMYTALCRAICEVWSTIISKEDFKEALKNYEHFSWLCERGNEIYEVLEVTDGQGLILIAGGEPNIVVKGSGKGGRNQELALTFSLHWSKMVMNNSALRSFDVLLLSAGTDGQDGPTDAAGAFGYSGINSTLDNIQRNINNKQTNETSHSHRGGLESISLEEVLKNNDSYTFYTKFNKGEDLLKTGFTGTNVMDLHLIYIKKRSCRCINKL